MERSSNGRYKKDKERYQFSEQQKRMEEAGWWGQKPTRVSRDTASEWKWFHCIITAVGRYWLTSLKSAFRYTFYLSVLEPDFTPVEIDGLSLHCLLAMRLWGSIGNHLIRNLRGFSEKLFFASVNALMSPPRILMFLSHCPTVSVLVNTYRYGAATDKQDLHFPLCTAWQRWQTPCPYLTLSFCRDKATTALLCFSSTKKRPLLCATWLPQRCSHYATPLIFHMNQPLMRTTYLPQWSSHSAAPLTFHIEATTMLHRLSSSMQQPQCCSAYIPQYSSDYAAPLIFHNEAARVLRRWSSTVKQPLCCSTYVQQWSSHYAAPFMFNNEAATVPLHLCSTMKQPLWCSTHFQQWSSHCASPLMFNNEAATMLLHLCSTMKQPLCCSTYL